VTGKQLASICWRGLKLLLRAAWSSLVIISVIITLMTGWQPFLKQAHDDGITGTIAALWSFLITLFTTYALEMTLLVVNVAILTYLLLDRSRARSREQFQAARKKRPVKRKRRKK
jgi:hypothetical protein